MTKKSDCQVIRDERAAEKVHLAHIGQEKRVAAAEADAALRKIEEARLRTEAKPEHAKRTFWQWLKDL